MHDTTMISRDLIFMKTEIQFSICTDDRTSDQPTKNWIEKKRKKNEEKEIKEEKRKVNVTKNPKSC